MQVTHHRMASLLDRREQKHGELTNELVRLGLVKSHLAYRGCETTEKRAGRAGEVHEAGKK